MTNVSASRPATPSPSNSKTGREFGRVSARETMATVLIVAAIAALAITSLLQSREQATAQSGVLARPAPSLPTLPLSVPLDSGEVGPFAFGHVVFDWDPAAPGGVPGFDSWPPGSRR
jgi:hypothetical protein